MTKNLQNARETMEQMYLERDEMGDVTFLVQGQRICAHRHILATQSPRYKAQFYGPHRDDGEIYVPYVSAAAFNVFLQFFYKETVDLTMDNIGTALDLAQQSLVETFVETCVQFLNDAIEANKVCIPYRLASLYDIESLRVDCERRISTNTMAVLASDDFLHCDRGVLLQILKLDTLNCSEMDVFTACIAWARKQCKQNYMDDGKPENLRAALGDAIYQIRFSSLTADEFAALHKSMGGFFMAEESIELLYITAKLKDFKSQNFNQQLRMLQNEAENIPKVQPSTRPLEINRFTRMTRLPVQIDVRENSHFSLTCTKPIRLHGIALGIHFDADELSKFRKILSFYDDEWALVPTALNCKVFQSQKRRNETMIIFEKPIERVTYFSCSIPLPSKRLDYEFVLHSAARVDNNHLKFAGGKWVTRLFFGIEQS